MLKSVRVGKDQWTSSGKEKRESAIEGLVKKFLRKRKSGKIGKDQWASFRIGKKEREKV